MHLHAITIGDIASVDRKCISTAAWKCCQGNDLHEQIIWLGSEDKVPPSWIELWKTARQLSLYKSYIRWNERIQLDMFLGDW